MIKNTRIRKIVNWVSAVILTPFVSLGLLFLIISVYEYYPNRDFNQNAWKTNKDKRYELSKNLIDSKLLLNKSKKHVDLLLGKPENAITTDSWEYVLGEPPDFLAFGGAPILLVHFKNNKVDIIEQRYTDD